MEKRIPLSATVCTYLVHMYGADPIRYNLRNVDTTVLFALFRCRHPNEPKMPDPGAESCLVVDLPNTFIKEGRTYISQTSINDFEEIMLRIMRTRLEEHVFVLVSHGHKLKNSILVARDVIGLSESEMSYESIKQRLYRRRMKLQQAG